MVGDEISMEDSVKSSLKSDKMSSSSSIHNRYKIKYLQISLKYRPFSFILAEETQLLHEKIAKLEIDNHDLNKQLLNMQHLYCAMRNEHSNLQFQVERANEQVAEAQIEKDQYIARAQRILQEKEKLISFNQENTSDDNENIFATYKEELK